MANQLFAGALYTDAGVAIVGATVNLYDRNTTTPVRATTTTDANGLWTISHATEGRFDVEIVNGSSIRRRKYDTREQIDTLEVANFRIRNPADTFDYDIVPAAITADRQLNLPLITATRTLVANDTPIADDLLLLMGTDSDIAAVLRSTILGANTALTGVLVGTPVTPAVAADSLIVSNITASGDILIAGNRGGNSEAFLWYDSSAGALYLYGPAAGIQMRPLGTNTPVDVRSSSATGGMAFRVQTSAGDRWFSMAPDTTLTGATLTPTMVIAQDARTLNSTAADPTTYTNVTAWYFNQIALTGTNPNQVFTAAATVRIEGPPTASGNASITTAYSFWVDSGNSRFDGTIRGATGVGFTLSSGAMQFGEATTISTSTGALNLTATSTMLITVAANTATTWRVYDGTNTAIILDTRTTVAADLAWVAINKPAQTIATAAGVAPHAFRVTPSTLTLTGSTGVDAMNGVVASFSGIDITDASAVTVAVASTLYVTKLTALGSVTITGNYIINTDVAGCFLTAAGVWTDASSRASKRDIAPITDWDAVLEDIQRTQAVTYVKDDPSDGGYRRYGVIAEDVPDYLAMPSRTGIGSIYLSGAAFAGVQALIARLKTLESEVASLRRREREE